MASILGTLLCSATLASGVLIGCSSTNDATSLYVSKVELAVTGSANEFQPELSPAVTEIVREAIDSDKGSARIRVGGAGASQDVGSVDLVLWHGQDVENDPGRRARLTQQKLADINAILAGASSTTGHIDLLDLMIETGRQSSREPAVPETVAFISSGLDTVDPLDLRILTWDFDADAVTANLQATGYLPDLTGKRVIFVGLGDATGTQRPLLPPLRNRLVQLWLSICRGARAVSCTTDSSPIADLPPTSVAPVPPVPVPDPPPTPQPMSSCTSVVDLPVELMFDPNSPSLLAASEGYLRPLADRVRGGTSVSLIGHTATWGPASTSRGLSLQRAQAIAGALVLLGVKPDRIKEIRGVGQDEPLVADRTATGMFIPDAAMRNRVVVATVSDC